MSSSTSAEFSVDPAALPTFGETLHNACVELMADYGLRVQLDDKSTYSDPPEAVMTAVADFEGQRLRGSVALRANRGFVHQMTRTIGVPTRATTEAISDWLCELVNQVLGRIKNKLRAFDVAFDSGLPHVVSERDFSRLRGAVRYRFTSKEGNFSGYIDVVVVPGFVLERRPAYESLVEEGDLILL